ncbi:MAG: glycine zipper 2TM domain-containing protein [Betaproteobacteria bacterium]|nr:glycine zipper 2TM domain-containing protein [Betaproteobacteria bacterium]
MKTRLVLTLSLLTVAPLIAGGCASNLGADHYSRGEARQAQKIQYGTVVSVRPVKIEGTKSNIGTVAGAATGGVIGRSFGSGISSAISTVAGAVAGGVGGAAVEEAVTRTDGLEITVKLESGETLAVVQQDEGEHFKLGERVKLVGGGKATRVTHDVDEKTQR